MNDRKRITISTEEVNRWGYRVLTDGIQLDGFLKNPVMCLGHNVYSMPIGRWEELEKENGILSGIPVFDETDELGKAAKFKYENGFLHAVSIHFDQISSTSDPKYLLAGQTLETVTESDLKEISFVTVPGNKGATLSADAYCLSAIPNIISPTPIQKMDLTKVNIALGLAADATEEVAVAAIGKLSASVNIALAAQTDALIETGKANGVVTEANEASFRKLAAADFAATQSLLSVKKIETPAAPPAPAQTLTGMLAAGTPKPAESNADAETFDELQKKNPARLTELKSTDPAKYKQLAADYAAGQTV